LRSVSAIGGATHGTLGMTIASKGAARAFDFADV